MQFETLRFRTTTAILYTLPTCMYIYYRLTVILQVVVLHSTVLMIYCMLWTLVWVGTLAGRSITFTYYSFRFLRSLCIDIACTLSIRNALSKLTFVKPLCSEPTFRRASGRSIVVVVVASPNRDEPPNHDRSARDLIQRPPGQTRRSGGSARINVRSFGFPSYWCVV